MGRQIQMWLSPEDEAALLAHLRKNFPHADVVDRLYPSDWDRRTLRRTSDAREWLLIDRRAADIVCASANILPRDGESEDAAWQARSLGRSCIEWDRWRGDRTAPMPGRLYLNTREDPAAIDVAAVAGDAVEKMYLRAQSWVRRNCENCADGRIAMWISPALAPEHRALAERRKAARDARMARDHGGRFRTSG